MTATLKGHLENQLQAHKTRLARKKQHNVVQDMDFGAFVKWLENENTLYGERFIARHVNRLGPVLGELDVFIQSITTMVQGGGSIACFVWGAIQAVLVGASKYAKVMDSITVMIEDMSLLVPQLAIYSTLFPGRKALDTCIQALVDDYAGFCVEAVIFFKRWPIDSLLRVFWCSLDRKFNNYRTNIVQHLTRFHGQRRVIVDQEVILKGRALAIGQERIEAMLPKVNITAKEPEKLYVVPLQRNHHFHARSASLSTLHSRLHGAPGEQRSCLVHGGGGVGKTQLVLEYTYQYRDSYDYIIWICAETELDLANGMAGLAKRLELCTVQDATNRATIEAARTWLETTKKQWLLVFDNADRWDNLKGYWPSCAAGSILVTSQVSELGQATSSALDIRPLAPAEGGEMLLDQIGSDTRSDKDSATASKISEAIGGLPLAISHVAGYIRQTQIDLDEFLTLLGKRQHSARIFNEDTKVFQYDKSLKVVHDIALQQLDPDSLKLAQVLAMLSPEGVPVELLTADCHDPALAFLKSEGTTSLRAMIRSLRARHLIGIQGSGNEQELLTHRSLQLSILHKLDEKRHELQAVFNMAVTLARYMFPRQSPVQFPQNNLWEKCKRYSVQVMSVMSVSATSDQPLEPSIDYALLLSDVSNYFYERNIFGDAIRTSDAAEVASRRFGDSHESVRADIHTITAAVRDTCGISERSKTFYHYQMAVSLRQKQLNKFDAATMTSDDLWNFANAWGNMTPILLDYGCYEDVILYADLALAIKRKLLGSGSESVIACYEQYRNKHIALAALGHVEEALKWEPDPENCMDDPTYTVIMIRYYFFHANIAIICGQLDSAYKTLQRVLKLRIKFFGPHGRSTMDTYYLLAMLELKRDNIYAAETYLQTALERPEEWTPEALARAKYRLAQILLLKHKDSDAQVLLKEASKVRVSRWEAHAKYWPNSVPIPDEDAMYDHIVPIEAGRLVLTPLPSGTFTPELNDICRDQLARLTSTAEPVLGPLKLAETLRTRVDIPVVAERINV